MNGLLSRWSLVGQHCGVKHFVLQSMLTSTQDIPSWLVFSTQNMDYLTQSMYYGGTRAQISGQQEDTMPMKMPELWQLCATVSDSWSPRKMCFWFLCNAHRWSNLLLKDVTDGRRDKMEVLSASDMDAHTLMIWAVLQMTKSGCKTLIHWQCKSALWHQLSEFMVMFLPLQDKQLEPYHDINHALPTFYFNP